MACVMGRVVEGDLNPKRAKPPACGRLVWIAGPRVLLCIRGDCWTSRVGEWVSSGVVGVSGGGGGVGEGGPGREWNVVELVDGNGGREDGGGLLVTVSVLGAMASAFLHLVWRLGP